jgi:putative ABC transport system permease protein
VLLMNFRYAIRMLIKTPLFTAVVVGTLALGIGATTAIFSVVNAVMLRPLPYSHPERLAQLAETNEKLHLPNFGVSVLNYLSWRERNRTFEQLGAIGFAGFNLSGPADAEQVAGSTISPSLLPVLGIEPLCGTGFREGDDKPGAPLVAMISEGVWKRRFGGDRGVIGQTLRLDDVGYTVVGVAPPALALLTGGDVWVPLTIDPGKENRLHHVISVVGRLKPGVSLQQAQVDMSAVSASVGREFPEVRDWGIRVVGLHSAFVSDQLGTALWVLLAAVAAVLLIACANIANLLLARANGRRREIAVRTALGASPWHLVRQLLIESLALSMLGGGVGLAGALFGFRVLASRLPANLLPIQDITIDAGVLIFALAVTLATGMIFGLVPAWHAARADLSTVLKQAAPSSSGGVRPALRKGLAAVELALATVLLIGAGLLVQTLLQLQRVPLGFDPGHLLTFQVSLPDAKYPDEKGLAFHRTLVESLRAIPGVRDAAVSSGIPLGAGNTTTTPVTIAGRSILPEGTAVPIDWRIVSPGYFRAMGIPLLRGRDFTAADDPRAPAVVIVSRSTARKFWGETDPIGGVIHVVGNGKEFTVVGVVGDVRHAALNQESLAMYYSSGARLLPLMDVVVAVRGAPESVLASVRQKVRELDPSLGLANVRSMDQWVSSAAAQPRLSAALLGIFAAAALVIAAIGIYGVLAYSVAQRTRELGVRIALGAQPGDVVRLVLREGMAVCLAGVGAGLAGALLLSRVLAALVFGVSLHDPSTFLLATSALALVALAACLIPARRAARVDPMVALRYE